MASEARGGAAPRTQSLSLPTQALTLHMLESMQRQRKTVTHQLAHQLAPRRHQEVTRWGRSEADAVSYPGVNHENGRAAAEARA